MGGFQQQQKIWIYMVFTPHPPHKESAFPQQAFDCVKPTE
jgi:hypothetical protein